MSTQETHAGFGEANGEKQEGERKVTVSEEAGKAKSELEPAGFPKPQSKSDAGAEPSVGPEVEFFDKLKKYGSKLTFRATGRIRGHVVNVEPREYDQKSTSLFGYLLAILGGGLAGEIVLILKSLSQLSTSQAMGIVWARPTSTGGSGIALFGHCLEAGKDRPDPREEFGVGEIPWLQEREILDFLKEATKKLELIRSRDEYAFIERLGWEGFADRFRQSGVWILTDNIGFEKVRSEVFPSPLFFSTGPMEVLFELRECMKHVVKDVTKLRFDGELLDACRRNYLAGFICDEVVQIWQKRFVLQSLGNV